MTLLDFGVWVRAGATRLDLALAMEEVTAVHEERRGETMPLDEQVRHLLEMVIGEAQAIRGANGAVRDFQARLGDPWAFRELSGLIELRQWAEGPGRNRPLHERVRAVDMVLEHVWLVLREAVDCHVARGGALVPAGRRGR